MAVSRQFLTSSGKFPGSWLPRWPKFFALVWYTLPRLYRARPSPTYRYNEKHFSSCWETNLIVEILWYLQMSLTIWDSIIILIHHLVGVAQITTGFSFTDSVIDWSVKEISQKPDGQNRQLTLRRPNRVYDIPLLWNNCPSRSRHYRAVNRWRTESSYHWCHIWLRPRRMPHRHWNRQLYTGVHPRAPTQDMKRNPWLPFKHTQDIENVGKENCLKVAM